MARDLSFYDGLVQQVRLQQIWGTRRGGMPELFAALLLQYPLLSICNPDMPLLFLCTQEVTALLKSIGEKSSKEAVRLFMAQCDTDGNGTISLVEFMNRKGMLPMIMSGAENVTHHSYMFRSESPKASLGGSSVFSFRRRR